MAEGVVYDVFDQIAQGLEPPAPILCATVLQSQGEYDKAGALYKKLLGDLESRKKEGKPQPNFELVKVAELSVLNAETAASENRNAEALALYEKALALHLGPRPPVVDEEAEKNKAALKALMTGTMGAEEEEEEEERETPKMPPPPPQVIEQEPGAKDFSAATIRYAIAGLHQASGKFEDAEKEYLAALEHFGACGRGDTQECGDLLFDMAQFKQKVSKRVDDPEGISLLERALKVEEMASGFQHVRSDQVRRALDEAMAPLRWVRPDPKFNTVTVEKILADTPIPKKKKEKEKPTPSEDDDGA